MRSIVEDATFTHSQITDLGDLESIGGNADFSWSKITDLGNLQNIGGDAYFRESQITNLGKLERIGGDAKFEGSKTIDLRNLQSIGGQDLKPKFSAIQSKNQKNELLAIGKRQRKNAFFDFLKSIKNRWFGKEKDDIKRGDE